MVLFLLGTCFLATSSVQLSSLNGSEITGKAPKVSGYWDLTGSLIFIDDNWSLTASSYGWCYYNGTHYIIENVTLDVLGSGSGITIKNSNDFFEIRNCTIYNATGVWSWSAISMDTVSNGRVIRNNLSNNNIGVYSLNSNDVMISHNVMDKLESGGIYSELSDTVVISHNNISRTVEGIWTGKDLNDRITGNRIQTCRDGIATSESNFTHVIGNIIYNMTIIGIDIYWAHDSFISENEVSTCDWDGIFIKGPNHEVTSNTMINNGIGIEIDGYPSYLAQDNLIIGNVIIDSVDWGIYVEYNVENNTIYLNELINNAVSAIDMNYFANDWDNGSIGNYYSDYAGKDVDDDGIGDIPRNITAYNLVDVNAIDNFPIWWDHPSFSITSPTDDQVFQETLPSFSISITEGVPVTMWYTLNNGPNNYITSTSGTINQNAWDALSNGDVFIRLYVSDARGWTTSEVVRVFKDVPEPPPSDGDEEAISGYDLLLITTTMVASLAIVMILRKRKLNF